MTDSLRLALIIPTKDRPEPLRQLLASLVRQSQPPAQVIVVDGGAASVKPVLASFPALPLRYVRAQPPGLTRQKNLGIAALDPDMTLVGFLDDDLVLEDDALAAMLAFWRTAAPTVGGAGLTLQPESPRRAVWIKRWFGLDASADGCVLPSGYNTPLRSQSQPYASQWLAGGASVWRRAVVDAHKFDEWFTGYSYLEDVDYSLRVGRQHVLWMVPSARARHESLSMRARQHYAFGRWQITHRWYLALHHPELSRWACAWALIGQCLVNLVSSTRRWGWGGLARTLGNLAGWCELPWAHWSMRRSRRRAAVKQRTGRRFGYLWSHEDVDATPPAYHYRLVVEPLLPPGHAQGRVLDAGCGTGIDTAHLAQAPGSQVVAVEFSADGSRKARERTQALPNVSVVRGDLEHLALQDGSCDFVYSYGVLHHLTQPERAFGELVRVLKPGGWLAVYVYEDFSTHTRVERWLLALATLVRRVTTRMPQRVLYALCWLAAPLTYLCCALPSQLLARWRATYPLSQRIPFRHGRSWFGLTGDLYDRFAAPIEERYSQAELEQWCAAARLQDVSVSLRRGWVIVARKPVLIPSLVEV